MHRAFAAGLVLALGIGPPAVAQVASSATASDKVAAEALFEEGRQLVGQDKVAEACPKFVASERLDPSSGTLLNLANCWERLGRTATAWATYRQAASAANAEGRRDYVATAQRHADALAPKLARLTLNVVEPSDGLEIKRDGLRVTSAEWSASIPIDPGPHVLVAAAPGRKSWVSSVDVPEGGAQLKVDIPPLEPLVDEAPPAVALTRPASSTGASPTSSTSSTASARAAEETSRSSGLGVQRAAGLVVAGLGVVGLGVGTGLAVSARSQYDESLGHCGPGNRNVCTALGVSERDSARNAGNFATIAFGVGGAALVSGAILWLTAPRRAPSDASTTARFAVVPTLGGAFVTGTWR